MTLSIRQRAERFAVAVWVALAIALLAGSLMAQDAVPPVGVGEAIEAPLDRVVPLPPGLPDDLLAPEPGSDAAQRALMTLEAALAQVEPTVFTSPDDPAAPDPQPASDLSPLAQHAIENARSLMLAGRNFDAVDRLLEAQRLAPDHPLVARMLGLAYVRGGNHVRGASYLQQAAALNDADTEVRVVLARLALEKNAWDEALALAASVDVANSLATEPDLAAQCFADYARAVALDRRGLSLAAAACYERVLASQAEPGSDSAAGREVYVLREQADNFRQRLGDLHLRLGEPARAIEVYQQAEIAQVQDPARLTARLVYTYLLLGQRDDAVQTAVAFFATSLATEHDAPLIGYLVAQEADPVDIDAQLVAAQQHAPQGHFPLVAARAVVLPQSEAVGLIDAWLNGQPARLDTFRRAIALLRGNAPPDTDPPNNDPPDTDSQHDDPQALAHALVLTAKAMRREPTRADEYAQALLDQSIDAVQLIRALRCPEVADTDGVMLLRLSSAGYHKVGRVDDAAASLARALVLTPDDAALQLTMVERLIDQGIRHREKFGQASDLLGDVRPQDSWPRFTARINILRLQSKPSALSPNASDAEQRANQELVEQHATDMRAALGLIESRMRTDPNQMDLLLLNVRVLAESGRFSQAINTLKGLIERYPTQERIYELGSRLHRFVPQGQNTLQDNTTGGQFYREYLIPKMDQFIPRSHNARLAHAVRFLSDPVQPQLARPILEELLAQSPADGRVLNALMSCYRFMGDTARHDELSLRWIALFPPGLARRYQRLDFEYERGNHEQVAALVRETFALVEEGVLPGPPINGDIALQLLYRLSRSIGSEAADEDYLHQLQRFPDNPGLNNLLGYQWAVAGKNLLGAEAMVQRALDADGENSSYLDSMAWVLYKMGRFDEARAFANRAITRLRIEGTASEGAKAVQYDHMGDILYQCGDTSAALRMWREAFGKVISPQDAAADPETATVLQRCQDKIAAIDAGQVPAVSEVPGEQAFGDEGHPAQWE